MSQAAEKFREDFEDVANAISIFKQYRTVGIDHDYDNGYEDSIVWDMIDGGYSKRTYYIPSRYGSGKEECIYDPIGIFLAVCVG